AFQSNNQLATATAAALLVVVLTGIFGRFIYGLVPASGGKDVELADLLGSWERLKARIEPMIQASDDPALLQRIFAVAARPPRRGPAGGLLARGGGPWPGVLAGAAQQRARQSRRPRQLHQVPRRRGAALRTALLRLPHRAEAAGRQAPRLARSPRARGAGLQQ